jgi:hypothetical protein
VQIDAIAQINWNLVLDSARRQVRILIWINAFEAEQAYPASRGDGHNAPQSKPVIAHNLRRRLNLAYQSLLLLFTA